MTNHLYFCYIFQGFDSAHTKYFCHFQTRILSGIMSNGSFDTAELQKHLNQVLERKAGIEMDQPTPLLLQVIILGFLFAHQSEQNGKIGNKPKKQVQTHLYLETSKIIHSTEWRTEKNELQRNIVVLLLDDHAINTRNVTQLDEMFRSEGRESSKLEMTCLRVGENEVFETSCAPVQSTKLVASHFAAVENTNFLYDFSFFLSVLSSNATNTDMIALKHEIRAIFHHLRLYFSMLGKAFKITALTDYFAIFVHSVLEFCSKTLLSTYIHAIDTKSFIVYFGSKSRNYLLVYHDDEEKVCKRQKFCLDASQMDDDDFPIGIRVKLTKSDSIVEEGREACLQPLPALVRSCIATNHSNKVWINSSLVSFMKHVIPKHQEPEMYILGQFLYAASLNTTATRHSFWVSSARKLNSSSYMLIDSKQNVNCFLNIRQVGKVTTVHIQKGDPSLYVQSHMHQMNPPMKRCRLGEKLHVDELTEFFNYATFYLDNVVTGLNFGNILGVFEGYFSNEWAIKALETHSFMKSYVLTSDNECLALTLSLNISSFFISMKDGEKRLNSRVQNELIKVFLSNPKFATIKLVSLSLVKPGSAVILENILVVNEFVSDKNCSVHCDKSTQSVYYETDNPSIFYLRQKSRPQEYRHKSGKCQHVSENESQKINRHVNHYMPSLVNMIEDSLSTKQWRLTGNVWVNHVFRDVIAFETIRDERNNLGDIQTVVLDYAVGVQEKNLPNNLPQSLLTFVHMFKTWRERVESIKSNRTSIKVEQNGLHLSNGDQTDYPWHINIFYTTGEEFKAVMANTFDQ